MYTKVHVRSISGKYFCENDCLSQKICSNLQKHVIVCVEQTEHEFFMQDGEQDEQEETPSDTEAIEFINSSVNTSNISIGRSGHACILYTGGRCCCSNRMCQTDRQQIFDLFVETFSSLLMVLNIFADENIEPVCLWEKVDAIMTDAAKKTLGIEETVPTTLGSSYL